MSENCVRHSFEVSTDACRTCHNTFCARCLVYPFGDKKPPYCVACALAAAGVRASAGTRPAPVPVPMRESRQDAKARRKAERAARKAAGAVPAGEPEPAPPAEAGVIPSPFPSGLGAPTPH